MLFKYRIFFRFSSKFNQFPFWSEKEQFGYVFAKMPHANFEFNPINFLSLRILPLRTKMCSLNFSLLRNVCVQDVLGNLCGFIVIVIAVMLLNTYKEFDLSIQDMKFQWRCKRDHIKYTVEAEEEAGQIKQIGSRQSSYGTPQQLWRLVRLLNERIYAFYLFFCENSLRFAAKCLTVINNEKSSFFLSWLRVYVRSEEKRNCEVPLRARTENEKEKNNTFVWIIFCFYYYLI